jgi:hypothetical protein
MSTFKHYSDEDLIVIGRRHGSEAVADEADAAIRRWTEDLRVLTNMGFGAATLAQFSGICAEHKALCATRSEAVAGKSAALKSRDDSIEDGWEWVEDVLGALGVRAMFDGALAGKLNAARPQDDVELATGLRALRTILEGHRAEIDAEFDSEGHLARAEPLATAIEAQVAGALLAKGDPKLDTQALDLLEGRIVTFVAHLNKQGRRAFARGDNAVRAHEYRYHYLTRRGARRASPTPPADA